MATKRYIVTAWTEEEINKIMQNRGTTGYSECYYENKRSFKTADGKTAWAVDCEEFSG